MSKERKSRNIAQKSLRYYKKNGLRQLINKAPNYLYKLLLESKIPVIQNQKELEHFASRFDCVGEKEDIEISYNGIWEEPHPAPIGAIQGNGIATRRFIYEVDDAALFNNQSDKMGGSQLIIHASGRYIVPCSINAEGIQPYAILTRNLNPTELLSPYLKTYGSNSVESGFLLAGHTYGFGHWSSEILPKLRVLEEYYKNSEERPILIVGDQLTSWQKESLSLMGYPPKSIIQKPTSPLKVQRLILPTHHRFSKINSPQYPSPSDLKWVRKRVLGNLSIPSYQSSSRIYISRQDAQRRQVENHEEVENMLEKYDFEMHVPGSLPYKQQVNLFSNADIIVGPHGAGLSNVVFARNAHLIEFLPDDSKRMHYFLLSNLMDHSYEYVPSKPIYENETDIGNRDLNIDIDKLQSALISAID